MTTEELIALGEKVFGKSWKAQLAQGLGVYLSTINRWATGYTPISRKNERAILSLAEEHLKRESNAA